MKFLRKIGSAIKEFFRKFGELLMVDEDPYFMEEETDYTIELKSSSMKSLVMINDLMKDYPIKKTDVGLLEVRTKKINNRMCKRLLLEEKSPIITIKANCEVDRKTNRRTMKVRHLIRTIGVDNNVWEISVTTYCQCITFVSDWDQVLIQACNIYCDGILRANDFSKISLFELLIPNIKDVDIIQKKTYDGYVMTYGDESKLCQFIPYYDMSSFSEFDNDELKSDDVKEKSLESYKKSNVIVMDVIKRSSVS